MQIDASEEEERKKEGEEKNKSALWLGLHLEKGCWELVGN